MRDAPGGAVIYSADIVLEGVGPGRLLQAFLRPFKPLRDYVISGLDAYYAAEVTLTLSPGQRPRQVEILAAGDLKPLVRRCTAPMQAEDVQLHRYRRLRNTHHPTRKATTDVACRRCRASTRPIR